jgi:hypothetical protein
MLRWDEKRNIELQRIRNISFEEITDIIVRGEYIEILEHPARENQQIFIISIHNYTWAVPFVLEDDNTIFLKTAYPSRKMHKKYGKSDEKK